MAALRRYTPSHFAEQGMVAAHGGIFRTGRLHADNDPLVRPAEGVWVAQSSSDLSSPDRKKQGYGLATVPCGPDPSEQTDDYTLFGRRGS